MFANVLPLSLNYAQLNKIKKMLELLFSLTGINGHQHQLIMASHRIKGHILHIPLSYIN